MSEMIGRVAKSPAETACDPNTLRTLADRIRSRLNTLNKNPSSVALEAGLGRSAVRDILVNDQNPRIDTLKKLTGPLQCTLYYLSGEREEDRGTETSAPRTEVDPLIVLRTILCANPTPEHIVAALAANGLEITSVAAKNVAREIPNDPLDIVREIIQRRGMTATSLARACGLAASTLNKVLKNAEEKSITTRTLQKIREWDQAQ